MRRRPAARPGTPSTQSDARVSQIQARRSREAPESAIARSRWRPQSGRDGELASLRKSSYRACSSRASPQSLSPLNGANRTAQSNGILDGSPVELMTTLGALQLSGNEASPSREKRESFPQEEVIKALETDAPRQLRNI